MEEDSLDGLYRHFGQLPDPRAERARRHESQDILVIAVCAVIFGADGWVEIEEFGRAKLGWFRSFLDLPNGIPSRYTLR